MGFPQIPCPGILENVGRWDILEVDWEDSLVRNVTRALELPFEPLPEADRLMLEAGGLIGYLHARDGSQEKAEP